MALTSGCIQEINGLFPDSMDRMYDATRSHSAWIRSFTVS